MSAVPTIPEDTPLITDDGGFNRYVNTITKSLKLRDDAVENLRPMKVIVIGAGYSGIYLGIRIPERLRNVDLVIYEKNDGVGGTWYENRYLGIACDIPSHSYQYSFEPNPNWSALYAPGREIQAYLESVARKYSADRFIKISHEVIECRWDDRVAKWNVSVKNLNTGEMTHDQSDVVISARGNLNHPSWPHIDGLNTFEGEVMHSAKWNEKYDFTEKRIGVIGSGSSSIQIVPSLQRIPGTHVTTFARGKTWISPSFGHSIWERYRFEGFAIPEEIRKRFLDDPEYYAKFRRAVEEDGNSAHAVTIRGTPLQLGAKQMFHDHMKSRLEGAPHLFDALLPSFSPGCRRLTPGPGFLEALTQPNVALVTSEITRISAKAVHTVDGAAHPLDTLICATGFNANAAPPFPLVGAAGLSLREKWSSRPTNYLGHSLAGFPNHFCMLGANSSIASGSLTFMIENVGDYVIKAIRKLQKEYIASMVVKQDREDDFTEYVDEYFKGTVFSEECRSWYKNSAGQVVGLWPGSTLHCVEAMRSPRWEDFEYVYCDDLDFESNHGNGENESNDSSETLGANEGARKRARVDDEADVTKTVSKRKKTNRLRWLGNGMSINEMKGGDLAWYLEGEHMSIPVAPRPEDNKKLNTRAFSY